MEHVKHTKTAIFDQYLTKIPYKLFRKSTDCVPADAENRVQPDLIKRIGNQFFFVARFTPL